MQAALIDSLVGSALADRVVNGGRAAGRRGGPYEDYGDGRLW